MVERILVALDGSELAEQVLPLVEELALKLGARVELMRAVTSDVQAFRETLPTGTSYQNPELALDVAAQRVEAETRSAESYLEGVRGRLASAGVDVQTLVLQGPAGPAIVRRARESGASLIALATHGRGGLGRLVFGSVADEVLRESDVPLLLVRPRAR